MMGWNRWRTIYSLHIALDHLCMRLQKILSGQVLVTPLLVQEVLSQVQQTSRLHEKMLEVHPSHQVLMQVQRKLDRILSYIVTWTRLMKEHQMIPDTPFMV